MLGTRVSCAKTDKPIVSRFGRQDRVEARNRVLGGVDRDGTLHSKLSVVTYTGKTALHFDHLPSARSGQVHSSDAAASAMRPLSDLFWALVFL